VSRATHHLLTTRYGSPSVDDERDIDRFARQLVLIYGFDGVEAEREQTALASALKTGRPVDYHALARRAGKHFGERDLATVLRRAGLVDTEVSRVLAGFRATA
jgi:hypothetical protein